MIGVVLAAGKGSRIQSENPYPNKCLIEIGGKPIIHYALEQVSLVSPTEIIIVIGHQGRYIQQLLGECWNHIPLRYVVQTKQLGIVHALCACSELLNGVDYTLALGDEILFAPNIAQMLERFHSEEPACVCGVVPCSNSAEIKKTYSIEFSDWNITELVEKPVIVSNEYKGTGFCIFSKEMTTLLRETPKNPTRNQYELCDWIQLAIDRKLLCQWSIVAEHSANINVNEDYLKAVKLYEQYIGGAQCTSRAL